MTNRYAYLLSVNFQSERTLFSAGVLERVGFTVILVQAIPDKNPVLSNKKSIQHILTLMVQNENEWNYIFEDDINLIEPISLQEIIEYESISAPFFYLGCCMYGHVIYRTGHAINNHPVFKVGGMVRGFHAVAFSKQGAAELLEVSNQNRSELYMDVILEKYCKLRPANVVRMDLESKCVRGHLGIFFQDRDKFKSIIE